MPRSASLLERAERGDTVELRPRRLKLAVLLLGSLVFGVPFTLAALVDPDVVVVLGALLFDLGIVTFTWGLVTGGATLRLSPEGIRLRRMLRTTEYAWDEMDRFRTFEVSARYHTMHFVGFDLVDRHEEDRTLKQRIDRGVSGVDVGLPDNYGLDHEDLAAALQRIRDGRVPRAHP